MAYIKKKRILIVDDNPNIHEDFKKILSPIPENPLLNIQEIFFGNNEPKNDHNSLLQNLEIDSAYQGAEAVELIKKAIEEEHPYALAFVDIRMPPGWDGINTIKEIWKIDPELQVVLCTAYSDYSWQQMFLELNGSENFLILKKPFDSVEIRQLTASLTKKWEYKHRLEHTIENLTMVVDERTEDLRNALELAEDANHLKNEFLGNISYELRVPLTSIIGFTELIYHGKADPKNIKDYCSDILSSSKYLLQMINDIIDMSQLENKSILIHPEQINMNLILDEIKDMFDLQLKGKNQQFSCKIDSKIHHVMLDSIRLKQILRHYVANAIKFTPEDGKILIDVFPLENEFFQIDVIDTGIGIDATDLKKLFIPFQQLDTSMSKKFRGTGLGLALVRRLVELQGGKVGVQSTLGKGSKFSVILPIKYQKPE